MRKIENSDDWYAGYCRDIAIAQDELRTNLGLRGHEEVCDIYALPSHNHQTFYCKVITEGGFMKFAYAKAIQNSIWFSEPIYMYRFEEAKSFEDHPIRRGRIFCGKKIVERSVIDKVLFMVGSLSNEQPEGLVVPETESEFTAIRVYDGSEVSREIMFTEADKLAFKEGSDVTLFAETLRDLHFYIERIIGIGVG